MNTFRRRDVNDCGTLKEKERLGYEAGSTILIVDDNSDVLIAAKLLLKKHYQTIITTDNPFDIEAHIAAQQVTLSYSI